MREIISLASSLRVFVRKKVKRIYLKEWIFKYLSWKIFKRRTNFFLLRSFWDFWKSEQRIQRLQSNFYALNVKTLTKEMFGKRSRRSDERNSSCSWIFLFRFRSFHATFNLSNYCLALSQLIRILILLSNKILSSIFFDSNETIFTNFLENIFLMKTEFSWAWRRKQGEQLFASLFQHFCITSSSHTIVSTLHSMENFYAIKVGFFASGVNI